MTFSTFKAATQELAIALLGVGAHAAVELLGSPVMSAAQPQLTFRIGLSCPGLSTHDVQTAAAGRAIVRAANLHWASLNLGMVHFISGSLAPSAQDGVVVFDVRMQPASYDHDA